MFVELVDSISKRTASDGVLENPISTPYEGIFCSECMFASVVGQATCATVGVGCHRQLVEVTPTSLRLGTTQFHHATSDMSVRRNFRRRGCIELVHGDKLACCVLDSSCPITRAGRVITHVYGQRLACDLPRKCCRGCGLTLQQGDATDAERHDCILSLRRRVSRYATRVVKLRSLVAEYERSRSALLARIAAFTSRLSSTPPQGDEIPRPGDEWTVKQHVGASIMCLVIFTDYKRINVSLKNPFTVKPQNIKMKGIKIRIGPQEGIKPTMRGKTHEGKEVGRNVPQKGSTGVEQIINIHNEEIEIGRSRSYNYGLDIIKCYNETLSS